MNTLQYLLQVNICLLLFFGFYSLMLRNETFFRLNRIYLISTAALSFVIPLLHAEWVRSLFITQQVQQASQNIAYVFGGEMVVVHPENAWDMMDWITVVYVFGCLIFTVRFLWQLYKVRSVSADAHGQAFSFFRRIVVSKDLDQYNAIHQHEEVHAVEWHSADVLFFEIIGVINWFNPVAYAFKKAIRAIHEFIADEETAVHLPSKDEYALLLVSKAFGVTSNQLTNNFYKPSLLKRRIIMLNKTKSRKAAILKYGLSAPLFVLMLVFTSATMKPDTVQAYGQRIEEVARISSDASETSNGTHWGYIPSKGINNDYVRFLKANPSVKSVSWSGSPDFIHIRLKSGEVELYNLKDAAAVKKAEAKYGKLPVAPPPPPVASSSSVTKPAGAPANSRSTALLRSDTIPKLPLYFIDGKQVDYKIMQAINPTQIQSINVLKGKDAIDKYGSKGKNGIIEVALKAVPADKEITKTNWQQDEQEVTVQGYKKPANTIFTAVEVLPKFPGGDRGWAEFVSKYKYPQQAVENGVSGRVILQFVVEEDGSLTGIKSVRDPGLGTGDAAIELLKTSPKWIPGMQNGRPVRVAYTQVIALNLEAQ